MYSMGIDIGSASSKVVIVRDIREIVAACVVPLGTGTGGPVRALDAAYRVANLERKDIDRVVATGYGRIHFSNTDEQVSEISCHAKGAFFLIPSARTIIDIGGQDAKVIRLSPEGNVLNFAMNEKCAAGTGRFLEVMARVLETDVSQLAELENGATEILPISSTCTVFAESEVISQLSAGHQIADVVAGIHESVAHRVSGLVGRIGATPQVVMTGGVAQNIAVVRALERAIKFPVTVVPKAQMTGALGAALIAGGM